MKLPRWLSPVRTVEAETGWPRALCRRFVSRSDKDDGEREVATFCALAPAAFVMLYLALIPLLNALQGSGPVLWRSWVLYAASVALGLLLVGAYMKRRYRRLLLAVARFNDQRWCLQCRSPMPADACSTCPECGEPIPPEIAKLAAERAGEQGTA